MKKKLKLKVLSILLVVLIVATIIPMGSISSYALKNGDYEYSVISGIGTTNNFVQITKYNGTGGDITIPSTIDRYTVTSIGWDTFNGCTGLKSVTIPNSVTTIGWSAFEGCTSLTAINVSEGNIDYSSVDGVLYNKDKTELLKCPQCKSGEFIIPDGVTSMGYRAFDGCKSLTAINVSESNTKYSSIDGVVYSKDKTSILICPNGRSGEFIIPDCVTSIGIEAFRNCTGLKSVTILDSLTNIDYGDEFSGCTSLTDINVSEGNTEYSSIDGILYIKDKAKLFICPEGKLGEIIIPNSVTELDRAAFVGCTGLTSVTIGDGVTGIGDHAFVGCKNLTAINVSEGNTVYSSIDGIVYSKDKTYLLICPNGKSGELTIPNSVTSIGALAFSDCKGLTNIIIPDSVTIIGEGAFYGTPFYNSMPDGEVYLGKVLYAYKGIMPKNTEINIKSGTVSITESVFSGCKYLTSVTIPGSVLRYDFSYCTGLKSVTIGNGATRIGDDAFSGCTGLKSVTIPDSVTSIGNFAFQGCTGLKGIIIPDSVTSIGCNAFDNTPFYNSLPDGEVYLGKVLYAYKGTMPQNTEIIVKSGTVSITDWAFVDCAGLKGVTIPDSVTSIGKRAFYGCTGLTAINVSESNTEWISFDGILYSKDKTELLICPQGKAGELTIPDSVISIGDWAFLGCTGLKGITIPNYVTSIGKGAFLGCTGLKGVIIPNSVTNIGDDAFDNTPFYNSLPDGEVYLGKVLYAYKGTMPQNTEIIVKSGTVSITDWAFVDCVDLKVVTIPDSVTSIGDYAFSNCTSLKSVTILSGVTSIGYGAFANCAKDFTIIGKKGSIAENYATENGINFIDVDAPPVPTIMLGDVNGDGKVTAADAILALRAEAKLITLSPEEFKAADVIGDGKVTAADAIKILRFEAKLITAL